MTTRQPHLANPPLLTVVLPTYNAATSVTAALESLAAQRFRGFEVLVMDGASTDNTVAVVNGFAGRLPGLKLVSEKDGGIYPAMNKALTLASGEWLYFLGADDRLYATDVLTRFADAVAGNAACRLAYGDVWLSKPIGRQGNNQQYDGPFDADKLLRKNICHQAAFYHRSLFERFGGFRSQYKIFADYDFNLRCFGCAQPQYLPFIVAYFSTDGRSAREQHTDTAFATDFLQNMATAYSYPVTHPFFTGRKKELLSVAARCLLRGNASGLTRVFRILAQQVRQPKQKFSNTVQPRIKQVHKQSL